MKLLPRVAVAAGVVLLAAGMSRAQTNAAAPGDVSEYRLKAVFLYNFAKFADWPDGTLGEPGEPIVVGVYDAKPFEGAFGDLEGKRAKGRPLILLEGQTFSELEGCHIVFLNAPDDLLIKSLLQRLRSRPVLTVGERTGFCRWGGIVNFSMQEGRVRLQVNRVAAEKAGLQLSAQLLEVSELVDKGDD